MMVEASMQSHDGLSLTDDELVSNLAVFFVAGHETTASATASMMYYLAAHPEIQERCRAEVLSVLGDDPNDDTTPTDEQLKQMTYLNNCIKETMRINPPTLGNLPRIASKDTQLGEFVIPKGTPLSMASRRIAIFFYSYQTGMNILGTVLCAPFGKVLAQARKV